MSLHPIASHVESLPTLDVLGSVVRVLLDGKQTHGAFGLVECILQPGGGLPLHVHHREEETLHVAEGEVEVVCGGHTVRLRAGDSFFAPRHVAHAPRVVGETTARLLLTYTPAGFERAYREIDALAAREEDSPERVSELLREHFGCECVPGAWVQEPGAVPAVAGGV
jgi:mannose-6-phosphate isomerase-like protein (cupin superfamily)